MSDTDAWESFPAGATPSTVGIHPLLYNYLAPGARVLDVGCAWGRLSQELAAHGYNVMGIDINEREIERACEGSSALDVAYPPSFMVADARTLPFRNETFDACVIQSFLTTLTDRESRDAVLGEVRRVLTPDGIAYFGVFGRSDDNPLYKERYDRDYPSTGTYGTFYVTDDGTPIGKRLYSAHHYSRKEVIELIGQYFCIRSFINTTFPSYHGNKATGYVILATLE